MSRFQKFTMVTELWKVLWSGLIKITQFSYYSRYQRDCLIPVPTTVRVRYQPIARYWIRYHSPCLACYDPVPIKETKYAKVKLQIVPEIFVDCLLDHPSSSKTILD
jgi:hypothetical protein